MGICMEQIPDKKTEKEKKIKKGQTTQREGKIEEELFKKENKKEAIFISIIFLVLIFGFSIASMLNPVKGFSENENRILQKAPKFSWERLFQGSFTKDYETFITDQFIGRDSWISLKTWTELILQKKEINNVFFGKDGYLIETQDKDSIDIEQLAKNEERLLEFLKTYRDKLGNDRVHAMLVPTASEVLKDKLPAYAQVYDQQALLEQISKKAKDGFIDVSSVLKAHASEYIFYRTDHHWTTKGAFYAYQTWVKACGITPWELSQFEENKISDDFYGTIYSKVNVNVTKPDEIYLYQTKEKYTIEYDLDGKKKDNLYELERLKTKDKYAVFLDGNHAIVQIDTQNKNGKKLLIIKDSYAHCFAPFASNHFETTYMIDFRYFNMPISKFIQTYKITDILVLYNVKTFMEDKNLYQLNR